MTGYAYYYGEEAEQFHFFRLPKRLVRDRRFARLSSDAKILYGILLDRMTLSIKNGWLDEANRVYIIYTVKEVMEELCCSERKAILLLQELDTDKGIGLIEKKRQGLGKPSLIYVKNFNSIPEESVKEAKEKKEAGEEPGKEAQIQGEDTDSPTEPEDEKPKENHMPGAGTPPSKNPGKEPCPPKAQGESVPKLGESLTGSRTPANAKEAPQKHPRDTDKERGSPSPLSIRLAAPKASQKEHYRAVWETFAENIGYEALTQNPRLYGVHREEVEEILSIMADAYVSQKRSFPINGSEQPADLVRARLMRITQGHIQYVLEQYHKQTEEIRNPRAYILACLFNASTSISLHYHNRVQYDRYRMEGEDQTEGADTKG